GYSIKGADVPTLVIALHRAKKTSWKRPIRWRVATASLRVATQSRLAEFKTCNKLIQILARAEAESNGADEALLLADNGDVAECSSGNLFWIERGKIFTP